MSCLECDRIQELNKSGQSRAYLNIGTSHVLIGACNKHFDELRLLIEPDWDIKLIPVVRLKADDSFE